MCRIALLTAGTTAAIIRRYLAATLVQGRWDVRERPEGKDTQGPRREARGEPESDALKLDAETLRDLDLTDRAGAEDVRGGAVCGPSNRDSDGCW